MISKQVDPYSNEIRYTLSLMAQQLSLMHPSSVRIASNSVEMTRSVVRYLGHQPISIFVESSYIKAAITSSLGVEVHAAEKDGRVADVVLFPFSLGDGAQADGENAIIAACHNALSYKILLQPFPIRDTIYNHLRRLKRQYHLTSLAGLFSPRFVWWLSLAKLVENWNLAFHFRLEDRAMRRLIEVGPLWRVSYIVVITGRIAK